MNPPKIDVSAWIKNTQSILGNITAVAEAHQSSFSAEEASRFEDLRKQSDKAFSDLKKASKKLHNIDIQI